MLISRHLIDARRYAASRWGFGLAGGVLVRVCRFLHRLAVPASLKTDRNRAGRKSQTLQSSADYRHGTKSRPCRFKTRQELQE